MIGILRIIHIDGVIALSRLLPPQFFLRPSLAGNNVFVFAFFCYLAYMIFIIHLIKSICCKLLNVSCGMLKDVI